MQGKLRIATVGTGYFSQFHYNAWQHLMEEGRVELTAVCNRTLPRAQEFAERFGFETAYGDLSEMLDQVKPDLLDIITPPPTHPEYVRAAVDRGIAAICQKPFTPSLADAESLVAYIEDKSGKVAIHENFRFQPWYGKLRQLIDHGAIGEPYQVTFKLRPGDGQGREAYLSRQPYFQQMERFLVHETAIHLIDTFRYLFGEMTGVYAQLRRLNPAIAGRTAVSSCSTSLTAGAACLTATAWSTTGLRTAV